MTTSTIAQRARVFQLRAKLQEAGGQCGLCQRAIWTRSRVTGCSVGENEPGELAPILAALLFQLAREPRRRCVARVPIEVHPDAYLAEDAPLSKLLDAAKLSRA